MENTTPTPEEIKAYFSKAKEIRCLNLDVNVDITYVKKFDFDKKTNSYSTIGGVVCVWKDGNYATITKKKCNPKNCAGCKPCQDKMKHGLE